MLRFKKLSRILILINVFTWISAPALGLAAGGWVHQQPDLAGLVESRIAFMAFDAADPADMIDVQEENLQLFLGMHSQTPPADDDFHMHDIFDGCCGLGEIICDGSAVLLVGPISTQKTFLYFYSHNVSSLAGMNGSPLYHPPKS